MDVCESTRKEGRGNLKGRRDAAGGCETGLESQSERMPHSLLAQPHDVLRIETRQAAVALQQSVAPFQAFDGVGQQ